jgi:hypothetical protein
MAQDTQNRMRVFSDSFVEGDRGFVIPVTASGALPFHRFVNGSPGQFTANPIR